MIDFVKEKKEQIFSLSPSSSIFFRLSLFHFSFLSLLGYKNEGLLIPSLFSFILQSKREREGGEEREREGERRAAIYCDSYINITWRERKKKEGEQKEEKG